MGTYGDFFGSVGQAAGGGLIGAGINAINQAINYKYATRMADYNFGLNEKAADAADARRRALYADFESPMAKIRQLKEAGLSPSIYAGGELGGGIGSATGAQGGGGAGAAIPSTASSSVDLSAIELNNAQADKLRAEAETIRGENELGKSQIAKYWAEAGATKASELLMQSQKIWQDINNRIANTTAEYQVEIKRHEARKMATDAEQSFWDALQKGLDFKFSRETYETNILIVRQQLANMIASESLTYNEAYKLMEEVFYMPDYADAAKMNAEAYSRHVDAICDNLPKQLELRGKELNVEKWRIGVGAFTECVRTAGYFFGASQLGDGGFRLDETFQTYDKDGNPKGFTRKTTNKVNIPKVPKI